VGEKDPGRKGKRRQRSARFTVDNELAQLASVLDEMRLDNNAYGWFRPTWRDGENAVALAKNVALSSAIFDDADLPTIRIKAVLDLANRRPETYMLAGDLFLEIMGTPRKTNAARLLGAALRCLQLKIANSHGGGAVYNDVLIPAFLPIDPVLVEQYVMTHRCQDSIGTSITLRGDRNDRQRAAFRVAWQRGLYLAAYSLPPAF